MITNRCEYKMKSKEDELLSKIQADVQRLSSVIQGIGTPILFEIAVDLKDLEGMIKENKRREEELMR